jgi:uncharacterized protein (TIGR02996 family)
MFGGNSMPTTEERGFLKAIKENPRDVATRLAYADWLEEQNRPYDALQQRVKAGISEMRFKLRRKSDGLFSDAGWPTIEWSEKGKDWRRIGDAKGHLTGFSRGQPDYGGVPWADVEIVVFEVRIQPVATMALSLAEPQRWGYRPVVVAEPIPLDLAGG